MAYVQKEEEMEICGKKCFNKAKAASYIGMKMPTFNKYLALLKAGRAKATIKFIQFSKGAPMWFEVEELDWFMEQVKSKGRAY